MGMRFEPRTARLNGQLPAHAEMKRQADIALEGHADVLAAPPHSGHAASDQQRPQALGVRTDYVCSVHDHVADPLAHQGARQATYNRLDFRKFRHASILRAVAPERQVLY